MGRKKKTPTATPLPAVAAPKPVPSKTASKQPLRRSARRANGLLDDNPNGCSQNLDQDEEDSQHSEGKSVQSSKGECTSGKEPQSTDLPPSTVVHKKFGMITCMPHRSFFDEVSSEPALQAPQVVQAVPFTRRRTRGSSIQDAQRMVEMVLAQEGEVIQHLEDSIQVEPVTLQQDIHLTSPDCQPGNLDEGMEEPVAMEILQDVATGEVMYEDGVVVREVAISWQENSNSMDVDTYSVKPKVQDIPCPEFLDVPCEKAVCMDTETESQDSEDTPMPILEKEQVPVVPSEESDSQASSTDNLQMRRRRTRRLEPKQVSVFVNNSESVNESDASLKDSDEDQGKFEGLDKLTAEDINKMVLGTNSPNTGNTLKTDDQKVKNKRNSSEVEIKEVCNNSIHQIEESISAINFNQKNNPDECSVNVPSHSSTIPVKNTDSNNSEVSISSKESNQVSPIKSEKNEVWMMPQPIGDEIPFLSGSSNSNDLNEGRSTNESLVSKEKPATRRQRNQVTVPTVKTRTKSSTIKCSEEKKLEERKLEENKPEDKKIEENIPDENKPEEKNLEEKKLEEKKLEEKKLEEKKLEEKKLEEKKLEEKKLEEKKLEEKKLEEKKLEEKRPEEKRPEEKRPEEKRHEEKKSEEKKKRGRKSSCETAKTSDASSGKSGATPSAGKNGDPPSSETTCVRSRRPRNGRKTAEAASVATPELKPSVDAAGASPVHTVASMVPPTMGSPTVPLSVHDLSMPVKVKSRWRRSSELEMGGVIPLLDEIALPPVSIPSPGRDAPRLASPAPEKSQSETKPEESHGKDEAASVGSPSRMEISDCKEGLADNVDSVVQPRDKSEKAVESGQEKKEEGSADQKTEVDLQMEERLRSFEVLQENEYRTERMRSKEWRRMVCDCTLTKEEIARGETGCGEDCLNRLLMIECGSRCVLGDLCSNKRFQNLEYGKIEVFKTEKKGYGLRAVEDLPSGTFLMEYVGEVIDGKEFRRRAKEYSKDKNRHYYFMALKSNTIIDATVKGNHSRFINHSCDPNAETQKWTVNGELRIGFFTKRAVPANDEITFDYQFQNYGKEAQKCYCEAGNCRGWIGGEPDKDHGKEWGWKDRESRGKKKERDKRREDIDVEEEIEKLCATGLKSRAHTLNICRLMVRAEEPQTRIQLLQLIRVGEQACRRLFLDYHGLSLIWSWMMDNGNSAEGFQVKLEILKTLKELPIPNKTMLQDSKVLSVVEKWSQLTPTPAGIIERKDRPSLEEESGSDTGDKAEGSADSQEEKGSLEKTTSNSADMRIESNKDEEDIKPKIEYSPSEDSKSTDDGKPSEGPVLDDAKATEATLEGGDRNLEVSKDSPSDVPTFAEIALELLKEWSTLKEVFRIPKKERIEQMKEHEREADKNFRNSLNDEGYEDKSGENSYDRQWRDRNRKKRSRDSPEPERRGRSRYDRQWHDERQDRWRDIDVRLSKAERRKQFALRVQQEEEEERMRRAAEEQEAEEQRRAEAEMWRQHEEQCRALGLDPVMTAALYQQQRMQSPMQPPQYYDPGTNQWLPYPLPADPNFPTGEYPPEFAVPGQFVEGQPPHMLPAGFPPRMFPGRHLPPGTPIPGNAIPGNPATPNPTDAASGQPIPTLSAGQTITPTSIPPPLDASQVVRTPQVPVIYPGAEVPLPVFHPAEGAQPFVPAMPGDPQLIQPGTTLPPYLPMVPIQLPPKWKSAKDAEGRTYYYHIKTRVSQWEPPLWVPTLPQPAESESSSDTSDDEEDDDSDSSEEEGEEKEEEEEEEDEEDEEAEEEEEVPAIQQGLGMAAHHQQHMMSDPDYPTFSPVPSAADERKKRRAGLVQERIISPRREEDRTDKRIYRQNKEKLRRQKEKMRKKESAKKSQRRHHGGNKSLSEKPVTVAADTSSDMARRIKDQFRVNMAGVIVQHLNPYRKPDCKSGRITNTEDFKHLARKLTHFVMVKELKHCRNVDDLECNDNVKHKARDFIKKYMAKFGEVYLRPKDDD